MINVFSFSKLEHESIITHFLNLRATCDLLPPLAYTCLFPFEQLIGQQMVQLQDSISKRLHNHTLSNMLFDVIFEAHNAQTLSCFSLRMNTWFIVRPVFLTFQLFSPIFSTTFRTQLGLPHPSIVSIPQCVCTHPINPMGIHLLHCVRGNKLIGTHDAILQHFCHHCAKC